MHTIIFDFHDLSNIQVQFRLLWCSWGAEDAFSGYLHCALKVIDSLVSSSSSSSNKKPQTCSIRLRSNGHASWDNVRIPCRNSQSSTMVDQCDRALQSFNIQYITFLSQGDQLKLNNNSVYLTSNIPTDENSHLCRLSKRFLKYLLIINCFYCA